MYERHFGLRQKPFDLTADPRFFYENAAYREAFASLVYAVRERRGFALLTGDVGTGKTTVLRRAIEELEPHARCVVFQHTMLDFDALVGLLCEELHVPGAGDSLAARLSRLGAWLLREHEAGRTVALFVDEAQHLSDDTLEHVRLLSNLETTSAKLVQIVLVGQPELAARLAQPHLRQLRQRIAVRARLGPLGSVSEVGSYIDSRLQTAGRRGRPLFTRKAVVEVAAASRGIARLVNVLCDNALLTAYAGGDRRVSAGVVRHVVRETVLELPPAASGAPAPALAGAAPLPGAGRPARWAFGGVGVGAAAGVALAAVVFTPVPAPVPLPVSPAGPAPSALVTAAVAPAEPSAPTPAALPLAAGARAAARPAPEAGTRTLVIQRGATLAALAQEHYDDDPFLVMDVLRDANRFIADVDAIHAGETLRLPPLTAETLSRTQPNGRLRVLVASAPDPRAARALAGRLERAGWRTDVTPRALSRQLRVTRVEIVNLPDLAAARRAVEHGRRLRLAQTGLPERPE